MIKAILGLTLCIALLSACTKKEVEDDGNLSVLRAYQVDDVKTWDPANAYDSVTSEVVANVYETLFQYSYLSEVYKVEPLLAASLPKYSRDRLTLTIPIKKGIKFQDDPAFKTTGGKGRELKAQDFVYSMKRLALPSLQSQGWWVVDGKIAGINAFHDKLATTPKESLAQVFEEPIEGLKALDDYTLQIKLIKPDPQLPYLLSMSLTAPLPREAVETYGDEQGNLLDHPVGTGPFKLSRWDRNHEIVLDRNPNFRDEKYPRAPLLSFQKNGLTEDAGKKIPFLDRIIFSIVKESQPRWLNFLKGNLDLAVIPKDNFDQAITGQVNLSPELMKKGIRLSIEVGVIIRYIAFNMKDSLVGSNKYLRQALSSAIDRDQWIALFTSGTGKKMVNLVPPGIVDRPKTNAMKYDYNLEQAKELLKKAGYPNGEGLPPIRFDLRGASTRDRQLGDFITQQFAQIGVKTEVVPNSFPAYLQKAKEGNLQVFFGGWAMDFPDAENIFQLFYGPNKAPGPGEFSFENADFDKLYSQVASMDHGPKRAQLFQKMDDILQEECPLALGYYEATYVLTQPWLLNYRTSEIILNKFKYFRLDKEIKKRYLQER